MASPLTTSSGLTLLPVDCFAPIARRRGSVWLDSSLTRDEWGRYSIIATRPIGELKLVNGCAELIDARGVTHSVDRGGLFRELEVIRQSSDRWAIGYVSYEGALPWLRLDARQASELPDIHFFVYDRITRHDNLYGTFSSEESLSDWSEPDDGPVSYESGQVSGEPVLTPTLSRNEYLERAEQIKHHIREGDIYQANLTCRFDARSPLDSFTAYLRLRRLNPCFYGAYLNCGDYQVLSSSPERMFRWENGRISSSPIKGTIARGRDSGETERNLQTLLHSEKDRAELVMIVDLVRNDLGKIARIGSVTVDSLYRAEIYSSLIHLVADISARTTSECCLNDVFHALLPGGSITGAPKRRAVEILQTLEVTPRSVYTGCVGYVGAGRAEFNIAIRTMIHLKDCFWIHAGGGIVADSDPTAEYEEMLLKARNLFHAVGVHK